MNTIKKFFRNIKHSFYNPEFYSGIKDKKFSKIVLLLAGLLALSIFVFALKVLTAFIFFVTSFNTAEFVNTYYPEGLEITAKDDQFSSNVEEPYYVPINTQLEDNSELKNALVIDTKRDLTLSQVRAHESLIVITKEGAVVFDDGESRFVTLKDFELGDFVITESNVNEWAVILVKIAKIAIVPLALVLALFVIFFSVVYHMFLAVFGALFVLFIGYLKKMNITYPDAYKISLYALIPGIVLDMIFVILSISSFPFATLVLFVVVVLLNVKKIPEQTKEEYAPTAQL